MSEMIERAARALASHRVYVGYDEETRSRLIEHEMHGARRDVQVVIEAMREPTQAMLYAGHGEIPLCQAGEAGTEAILGSRTCDRGIADAYRAMIDEARHGL